MRNKQLRRLCFAAMFAALILVSTMFIKVPVPATTEYIHVGDGILYLAAAVLPLPYAVAAAAIGAALADVLAGYAVWAPFTFAIKALMALCAGKLIGKNAGRSRVLLAGTISGIINVAGYFLASAVLYGTAGAAAGIPFNLLQSVLAVIVFAVLIGPVRRVLGRED